MRLKTGFFISCLFLFNLSAEQRTEQKPEKKEENQQNTAGFETEDSYIDFNEAVRSRQYVRRAILSSVVQNSSHFAFGRPYVNHLMGFNAVFQRKAENFTKYTSGLMALSLGYVLDNGLAFEGGAELSAVSDLYIGLRYIYRPEKLSLWPFVGFGGGNEVTFINFADGPPESKLYDGTKQMGFFTLGFLVPVVDVGIKAEIRGIFYGMSRWSLTSGVGVVIFL